jgi:hypothetical protein
MAAHIHCSVAFVTKGVFRKPTRQQAQLFGKGEVKVVE